MSLTYIIISKLIQQQYIVKSFFGSDQLFFMMFLLIFLSAEVFIILKKYTETYLEFLGLNFGITVGTLFLTGVIFILIQSMGLFALIVPIILILKFIIYKLLVENKKKTDKDEEY